MTKLKNTKKGMAKKALSVSLVAAMLATSNVPVWAAEDLFTDGSSAAVEAPVVETEAFSSEPTENSYNEDIALAASQVTDDSYSVAPVIEGTTDGKIAWNNANDLNAEFTLTSKESTIPSNIKFYYSWRIDGLASGEKEFTANTTVETEEPKLSANDAGKSLTLYICAKDSNNGSAEVWRYISDEIEIAAQDITDYMDGLTFKDSWDQNQVYDGKQHIPTKANIDWAAIGTSPDSYDIAVEGDTVNVTDEGVKVTIKAKGGYSGEKVLTYHIKPLEITNDGTVGESTSDHFMATLNTTSFAYTGKTIKIKKSDVTVVDKDHPEIDLSNYLVEDKDGYVGYAGNNISASDTAITSTGYTNFVLNLKEVPESGCKNYKIVATTKKVTTTNQASVNARDLSTVNVSIKSQPIPTTGTPISEQDILNATTFTDKTTGETLNLTANDITINVPSNITTAGNYTVTISAKAGQDKVKGTTTATLTIVAQDISGASFTKLVTNDYFADMMYTGEAITLTENQLGDFVDSNGKVIDKSLYDVTFNKNINVGTADVIVTGKGSLLGNRLVFHFDITPAEVTSNDISAATSVEFIDTTNASEYADSMNVVVKAKNSAANKEFTLEKDKDYKITYKFLNQSGGESKEPVVGGKVQATIEITNKNFKGTTYTFTKTTNITAKALKSEYIKLKESSFTYTGKPIEPAFDIRIDGRIIGTNESTGGRFTYEYSNNLNAGTATLTVKGNGSDYSSTEAKITFKIDPANTADLGGVIASKPYTGYSLDLAEEDFNLTLNGERINVKDNFNLTYGENLQVGEGTVTLTPKSGNFVGTRTFTFQIVGQTLNEGGTFTFYQNGVKVDDKNGIFTYDGNAKEFGNTVFTYDGTEKLTEGTDYDLVYVDNVYGKEGTGGRYGAVLAVAKGKYGSNVTENGLVNGIYTDAEGNKISNVIDVEYFKIKQLDVYKSNITVSNGVYAGGLAVKPDVKIVVKGKLLVEGQDYDLDFTGVTDRVNATTSKSLTVSIKLKNGYKC